MRQIKSPLSVLLLLVLLSALADEGFGRGSPTLMGHWKFEPDHITGRAVYDVSGHGGEGTIVGPVNLNPGPPALILNGSTTYVDITDGPLPTCQITLKAWAMVDEPEEWAGIVNYIQDNGSVEHGWILGQVSNSFMFGLSTGRITYLSANESFDEDEWYHVVGTYDGSQMNIYLNGEHAGSSSARSGDILGRSLCCRIWRQAVS